MNHILFLCSGNGGTARIIHRFQQLNDKQPCRLTVLVDRACGACSLNSEFPDIELIQSDTQAFNKDLISIFSRIYPSFVVTNVHRILPAEICDLIGSQLINVHYSLLPSFPGLIGEKTVHHALNSGVKLLGASCHQVTKDVDSGPLLSQAAFVSTGLTKRESMHLSFYCGCLTLANSLFAPIELEQSSSISFFNRQIIYNGPMNHGKIMSTLFE